MIAGRRRSPGVIESMIPIWRRIEFSSTWASAPGGSAWFGSFDGERLRCPPCG